MPSWDHHPDANDIFDARHEREEARIEEMRRLADADAIQVPEPYTAAEWSETEGSLGNCEECGTHGVDTDYKGADGRSVCDDCRENLCDECGADTTDGEGYDGLCGNCADVAERAGRWN